MEGGCLTRHSASEGYSNVTFALKDKLHRKYMADKVCQTLVRVWQSMKTCHKRILAKMKEENIWLMSGCVGHMSAWRQSGGGPRHMCIYNAHILANELKATGIAFFFFFFNNHLAS